MMNDGTTIHSTWKYLTKKLVSIPHGINTSKKLSYRRDSARRRSLRRSRSFKVTDVSINRKPLCDFPLVINTSLHLISHRYQVIACYWLNLRLRQVLFNTLVLAESRNSGPRNLASTD